MWRATVCHEPRPTPQVDLGTFPGVEPTDTPVDPTAELRGANRDNWDDRVAVHARSTFYDLDGWLASERRPPAWERDLVGDVAGLDLVHLQCHLGTDTLRWVTEGAHVTGLDFSPAAIQAAGRLADRAGMTDRSRFVVADVFDAAAALAPSTYDVVYVSLGAICWLPSIERWASQVAALLKPGGRLAVHDVHPAAWASADDEPTLVHTYFEEAEALVDDSGATYTDGGDPGGLGHSTVYEWNHSLGEIVTALLDQGLCLQRLSEHDWVTFMRFPFLVPLDAGRWTTPTGRVRLPLSFSLVARRPD